MSIARYLHACVDIPQRAVAVEIMPPPVAITPPAPDSGDKRSWRQEEIQAIAIDEMRKNQKSWPWIASLNGMQIYELSKIIATALHKQNTTDNARMRKLGLSPIKYAEKTIRGFMVAQSRNYAPLVEDKIYRNGGIFIRSRDGFYSGYPQPQLYENPSVTNTPEFKEWFDGSKIVDESGKPLIMYHGTGMKFDEFRDWRPAFFTQEKEYAEGYTSKTGKKPKVMKIYLSIKKPFDPQTDENARRIFNDGFIPYWSEKYPQWHKELKPISRGEALSFIHADQMWTYLRHLERKSMNEGYDGLLVDEGGLSKYKAVVPLKPSQIMIVKGK